VNQLADGRKAVCQHVLFGPCQEAFMQRGKYFKYVLLGPPIFILAVTALYPIIFALIVSFRDWRLARSLTPGDFVGFDNYIRAFSDARFLNAIIVTLKFVLISVPLSMILGLAMALLLQRRTWLNTFTKTLLILPFGVAPVLKGHSWRFMMDTQYGIFDKMIDTLIPPLANVVWLQEPFWALVLLAITEVWGWAPLIALMFLGALGTINHEILDAAKVDGATEWQGFWRVTLPMLSPLILLITLLRIISSLRMFDQVVTLTGGGPGDSTQTLNYFVYEAGFRFFDFGYSAALAYILMAILYFVAYFYVKALLQGKAE
jgi:multiple sugar transport system permease protein